MKPMLLFLVAALLNVGRAAPRVQTAPYVLEDKPARNKDFRLVTLRNRSTGRALWHHEIYDYKHRPANWSRSRRALVIEQASALLVWREGKPLLEIEAPAVPGSNGQDHYDYSMGSVWSPDGRRLLVRYGMSGMGDVDEGRLFCLTFRGKDFKSTVLPSNHYVRDMTWKSNRVASYRPVLSDTYQASGEPAIGKPRLWRVP